MSYGIRNRPVMVANVINGILPAVVVVLGAFDIASPTQLAAIAGLGLAVSTTLAKIVASTVYVEPTVARLTEEAKAGMFGPLTTAMSTVEDLPEHPYPLHPTLGPIGGRTPLSDGNT